MYTLYTCFAFKVWELTNNEIAIEYFNQSGAFKGLLNETLFSFRILLSTCRQTYLINESNIWRLWQRRASMFVHIQCQTFCSRLHRVFLQTPLQFFQVFSLFIWCGDAWKTIESPEKNCRRLKKYKIFCYLSYCPNSIDDISEIDSETIDITNIETSSISTNIYYPCNRRNVLWGRRRDLFSWSLNDNCVFLVFLRQKRTY